MFANIYDHYIIMEVFCDCKRRHNFAKNSLTNEFQSTVVEMEDAGTHHRWLWPVT